MKKRSPFKAAKKVRKVSEGEEEDLVPRIRSGPPLNAIAQALVMRTSVAMRNGI